MIFELKTIWTFHDIPITIINNYYKNVGKDFVLDDNRFSYKVKDIIIMYNVTIRSVCFEK